MFQIFNTSFPSILTRIEIRGPISLPNNNSNDEERYGEEADVCASITKLRPAN